jgi:hypothetical protein
VTASSTPLRLLLDEHYPPRLAAQLTDEGIDCTAVAGRDDLRGRDDTTVLRTAAKEGRAVVTEDVTTFSLAMAAVPEHSGVIFCHQRRFPRNPTGLNTLHRALVAFARAPRATSARHPFVWWLST